MSRSSSVGGVTVSAICFRTKGRIVETLLFLCFDRGKDYIESRPCHVVEHPCKLVKFHSEACIFYAPCWDRICIRGQAYVLSHFAYINDQTLKPAHVCGSSLELGLWVTRFSHIPQHILVVHMEYKESNI
jgi:hypothetical protein